MRKIRIKNSNNKEVVLTNKAPFILQLFEFKTGVNVYSSKSMNQDGASYEGNTLDVGEVNLQFTILAISKEDLKIKKRRINNIFNPKLGELSIVEENKKVNCIVTELPFFVPQTQLEEVCLINMVAHDPYYKDLTEQKAEIAIWKPNFEFPLEIPAEGMDIGYREPSLIVNILNKGDVKCGMKIVFKAKATVENPSLFNVNTREYFKVNKTMEAGEVITVTTHFQNKRVELNKNGVISNAFNYIDTQSTFLQLDIGDNLLRYDAESEIESLECSIWHTPQYLGV